MVQSQFSLSWDTYKSNICGGFSSLQQNGEFVDMTLAADGHFVKVHQVLIALVSPYLKELITSAPCPHPVIYLNNVSHRTLTSLLEYVYTGEALIPSECLSSFVETARNLHIKGLDDLVSSENMSYKVVENTSFMEDSDMGHVSGTKRMSLPTESGTGQVNLPAAARKILVKQEKEKKSTSKSKSFYSAKEETPDYSDMMDDSAAADDDDDFRPNDSLGTAQDTGDPKDSASNLQYSVSIRGSLQVVLNRYVYNLQSRQTRTGLRRWRCIEYRNHRCLAFVVTKGNVVLNRANLHNHAFHDKKIIQKIEKKAIFSALDDVLQYKEREGLKDAEDNDTSADQEGFSAIDYEDDVSGSVKKWSAVKALKKT